MRGPMRPHPRPPRRPWLAAGALLLSLAVACGRGPGEPAANPGELQPYYDLVAEWRPAPGDDLPPGRDPARGESPSPGETAGQQPGDAARDARPPGGPQLDPAQRLLYLPAGATAEFLLFLEPHSALQVERLSPRGAGARLTVTVEVDGRPPREVARGERAAAALSLPLGVAERVPARLSLRAEGGAGSGVALARPGLAAPGAASAAAPAAATPAQPDGAPAAGPAVAAAAAASGAVPAEGTAGAGPRPHVLVYLVDTLRADRLGCYGYPRPTSPHLDAFAAGATLFEHAVAQSSWTKAAVASMFTGVWPPDHGAVGWAHSLAPEAETLAEGLRGAGYRTAAFVTNPHVVPHFGFDQGFDDFVRRIKVPSDKVTALVERWLDRREDERPFFLYVHTMDPHAPYAPPEPYRSAFAPDHAKMPTWAPRWKWPDEALPFLSNLYDGEIARNDASFGALMTALRDRGLYDDTLVVVVSDHGEEFREHGLWRHGNHLHAEAVNVPLILKLPGQREGRRVGNLVQHVDLMPTLLAAAGVPAPAAVQGRDLLPLARGEASPGPDPAVRSHLLLGRVPEQLALVDGDWKLLYSPGTGGGTSALYRWREDPGERRDLAADLPVRTAVLTAQLHRRWRETHAQAAPEVELDAELQKTMRSLGYLQ